MILVVTSVRDAKSELFGRPIFTQSVGIALRSFEDEVNRAHEENIMYHHPEDFQLYKIGSFDDATGTLASEVPVLLCSGTDCKKALAAHISKV